MRPDNNEQKQKERPASSVLMLREIESKVQRHLSKQNAYSSSCEHLVFLKMNQNSDAQTQNIFLSIKFFKKTHLL